MEKQILEIIEKNCVGSLHPYIYKKETASEIKSHVMEFIEWMNGGCETNNNGKWYTYGIVNDDEIFKTSEELYQYWLNKVEK